MLQNQNRNSYQKRFKERIPSLKLNIYIMISCNLFKIRLKLLSLNILSMLGELELVILNTIQSIFDKISKLLSGNQEYYS